MYKLTVGGQKCIFETLTAALDEIEVMLSETEDEISVQAVHLTQEQYDTLPEFEGW